jgi:hypothetical protein
MVGVVIFLVLVLAVLSLAILAWVWWIGNPGGAQAPRWRNTLGFVGLAALSLQIFVFSLFEAYGFVTGSFSYRSEHLLLWGRVDFYLGVAAIAGAVLGKGWFRAPVVLSAVALEIIWFLLGTGL